MNVTGIQKGESKMKRYNLVLWTDEKGWETELMPPAMKEDIEGEWVKWEDVVELLGKLGHEASVVGFHERLKKIAKYIEDKPKCNCEENADAGLRPAGSRPAKAEFWICPVHGYKKR